MRTDDHASELGSALQSRLAEIQFPLAPAMERDVQDRVCDYADALKRLGLPPERVIVAVKFAANEAGIRTSGSRLTDRRHLDGKDKLLVDMVRWCIERYYGKPPQPGD